MGDLDNLYLRKFFENRLPFEVLSEWDEKLIDAMKAAIRADRETRSGELRRALEMMIDSALNDNRGLTKALEEANRVLNKSMVYE